MERVRDTKFDTSVYHKMLLNAVKFQGYIFNRFWVMKQKPTGCKMSPPPRFWFVYLYSDIGSFKCQIFHYVLQKELFTLIESNSNNTLSIEEYLKKIKPNLKHITNNL